MEKIEEKFIRENLEEVDWNEISQYKKLSKDFIREFQDKVNWFYISIYQKLNEKFIKEFQDKVDWYFISKYQKLSENFIREFQDKISWKEISKYQRLTENFIKEFQDKIDWRTISANEKISERNIKIFQDKLNWDLISKYQNLSENFIREFQNKVNWFYISQYQKLSEKFMSEFKEKVNYDDLSLDEITERNMYLRELDWKDAFPNLSKKYKQGRIYISYYGDTPKGINEYEKEINRLEEWGENYEVEIVAIMDTSEFDGMERYIFIGRNEATEDEPKDVYKPEAVFDNQKIFSFYAYVINHSMNIEEYGRIKLQEKNRKLYIV